MCPLAVIAVCIRRARLTTLLCLALGLAACGGGKSSAPAAAPSEPSSTQAEPTMKEQLAELEKQGVLPTLDRSTDIAGPDADNNGIRDDIDAYIANLPVNEPIRKATRQVARVQQKSLLLDLNDRSALRALSDASMASTACMSESAEAGLPLEQQSKAGRDGFAITLKIEAITANTPERAQRYLAYMSALNGTSTTYPTGKVCEDE
jgi:hypothetical protein